VLKVAVITVSDRAARGEYADLSGPRIREILQQRLPGIEIVHAVVADETEAIRSQLLAHLDKDYILTTGGTGLSARDITPEVCAQICDRELPGISEWLRGASLRETPTAVFSRAYSGQKGTTIIVNFPGSLRAAELCATLLAGILEHGQAMVHGGGHDHARS
jgi:molybdenum cofactor synthesis domain-containing protein